MRKWLLALLMTLMLALTVTAQETRWTVWLYDRAQGEAFLVDNTGGIQNSARLPIPAQYATSTFSRVLGVSPDGTRLAYTLTGTDANQNAIASFIVYDTAQAQVLFTHTPIAQPDTTSLDFTTVAFNETGNAVAFAYASGETWRVLSFNTVNGRIISQLDDSSPAMSIVSQGVAPFVLPALQYYGEATIAFNLIPYQTLGLGVQLNSYEWDVVTGRVIQSTRAPSLNGATLPNTGETIVPVIDTRTNYDQSAAPYTNALHIFRPELGARAPFYATSTYDILAATFVQNGERVVMRAQDLLTLNTTRLLIERNGISRALPPILAREDRVVGTPDGLVYVLDEASRFLVSMNTRLDNFPQSAIFTIPDGLDLVPVWGSILEESSSYGAWAQLAPPIYTAQALLVPDSQATGIPAQSVSTATPFAGSGGALTVNVVAFISTTEGDRLNMRSRPGLGGEVIARIENGVRVIVTDGPVGEDGFTWWQIRLSTGQTGWVVESADGIRTLIPAG